MRINQREHRRLGSNNNGFTLMEAIISSVILSMVALGVTRVIDKPAKLTARIQRDQRGRSLDRAVDTIIKDLQEASYQTVASNLATDPRTGIAPFAQYRFDGANRKLSWVSYEYNAQKLELWRVQDDTLDHSNPNPKKSLLLDHITPAFSLDPNPNSNIVIVNLTYNAGGQYIPGAPSAEIVIHERVAVRQ